MRYFHSILNSQRHDLSEIHLCIVDVLQAPAYFFIRDLDMINAFASYSTGDNDLLQLNERRHTQYFGEYLSQGSLNLRNIPFKFLSAKQLLDSGLAA